MTRPALPENANPKPTAPPFGDLTRNASCKKNTLKTKKKEKLANNKSKLFTSIPEKQRLPSHTKKETDTQKPQNWLNHYNIHKKTKTSTFNWKTINWEIARKNIYSPSLYIQSLQQLHAFHNQQIQKGFELTQKMLKDYRSLTTTHYKKQNTKENVFSSIKLAIPAYYCSFFAQNCAQYCQQWLFHQKQIIDLNKDYLNQWKDWHLETRNAYFYVNKTPIFNVSSKAQREQKKWPYSQSFIKYDHPPNLSTPNLPIHNLSTPNFATPNITTSNSSSNAQ